MNPDLTAIGNIPQTEHAAAASTDDHHRRLRNLAFQRLDREVLAHIATIVAPRLSTDDLRVLASVLREARRQIERLLSHGLWDSEADSLVETVSQILKNSELPSRPSNAPPFREFFAAAIEWYAVLSGTRYARLFETTILRFARFDLSAMPDLRERLGIELSEIGRRSLLPDELERFVRSLGARPYLLTSTGNLRILGFAFHCGVREMPDFDIGDEWLPAWLYHLGRAHFGAERPKMLALRDDVHARLGMLVPLRGALAGRYGGWRAALLLMLIKLDYWLFIKTRLSRIFVGRAWLFVVRFAARKLARFSRIKAARPIAASLPASVALEILDIPMVAGTLADHVISRAQGGFGDILTMRPGLIEAARRTPRGRVVFATNGNFFPLFSADDPIDLVDIERTFIDVRSFGRWTNLTECPAARVEAAQAPTVRDNRIDIFAQEMQVRFPLFSRSRVYPLVFDEASERAARNFVATHAPSGVLIGIQLRSAESYKDVPAMLDVARALGSKYKVFVFDSRPIPRAIGDPFIPVDDHPIRVVLAMVRQMHALLTPDSSFMHIAGTNNVPCLALFGSADGRVRCRPYPSVRYLDARKELACIPCWRNEVEKCRLANGYTSICLNYLTVPVIVSAFEDMLASTVASAPQEIAKDQLP